jgi:signal transduction histidine kinase
VFRRLRLPGKLLFAAVPLVVALVAVSTLYVQSAFAVAGEERRAAELSAVLIDLRAAVDAISVESADPDAGRADTDARLADLRRSVAGVDAPPLARQLDAAVRRLDQVRSTAADGAGRFAAYDQVAGDLLAIASLVPAEVANQDSARALEGASAIARARQIARTQNRVITSSFPLTDADLATVERIRSLQLDFAGWVDLFHTVASTDARTIFAQSGAPVAIGGVSTQITRLADQPDSLLISDSDWLQLLAERRQTLALFEERLTDTVRTQAEAAAVRATTAAWIVVAVAVGALILAAVATALISRSIVRRVRSVTERAQHVAQEQLPALVEALRDPGEDAALPTIPPIRDRGADEVGDLARSFAAMQTTLEHVAEQQVETLRKGVAEMFVTLARRNRSLIDRQLALIDELEADEDDPASLADYYRLDHIATRMRRNAESLLVLAGSAPPRTWRTPLGIDDVVRAAIGEIEDYRRVDVLTLEGVRLKGTVVADLSHLLSELLENAAQFSPPQSRVRVSGHFHEEGYLLTVSDRGVGIPQGRLAELNRLLERPPIIGLALEPTLGLYVVAMLARRHGIQVRLVPGAPGVSAKLLVPTSLYEQSVTPELVDPGIAVPDAKPAPPLRPRHAPRPPDARPITRIEEGRPEPVRAAQPPSEGTEPASIPTPIPVSRWSPPNATAPAVGAPVVDPGPRHVADAVTAARAVGPEDDAFAESRDAGGLPIRRPGSSYADDPATERPVSHSALPAAAVRSRLGAFQTGLEAGRRQARGDDE